MLGVPASTLESKIKQLGIEAADSRRHPDNGSVLVRATVA
jgi:hypothetical protein